MRRLTIKYAEQKHPLKTEVRGRKRWLMRGKKATKVQVRKHTRENNKKTNKGKVNTYVHLHIQ